MSAQRPNIVFVFADQWRHDAVGYAGDPNVKTPRMDELAAHSLRFSRAISSCPVCTPARASILTGQYPHKHGLFLNDAPLKVEDVPWVARSFKDAGYDTGYIGKWHVDGRKRSGYIPPQRRMGFDYFAVLNCTHSYFKSNYYRGNDPTLLTWEGYDAYAQTDDAVEYIRGKNRGTDKPYLLFLSWGPPHDPYAQAPADMLAKYKPEELKLHPNVPAGHDAKARKDLQGYYAHISAMDQCVGTLIDALRETGQLDNTLLILTSDHGDMLESHGQFNKQRPWDESLRIPLLMHWPARLGATGRDLDCLINVTDFMPTMLALAGIQTPAGVQGYDFTNHIDGGPDPSDGVGYYACYVPFGLWTRQLGGRECRGVRTKTHTYIKDLSGPWMLFDNANDPYQQHNLLGARETVPLLKRMDEMLTKKMAELGDELTPARTLIDRWGYTVDANETIGYEG